MKKLTNIAKLNILIFTILLGTLVFRFYLSDVSATAGAELGSMEREINVLAKQNESLKNEYLNLTSLSRLKVIALENGYVESQIEYFIPAKLASR